MTNKSRTRSSLRRISYRWHRRVGIVAAILVSLLAISGILLSHADSFRLYETRISAQWLPQSYQVVPEKPVRAFPTSEGWAVWIDGTLFLDSTMLATNMPALVGAMAHDNQFVAAGATELALFHLPDNQLIDRLGPASLPGTINRLGLKDSGHIVIETEDGLYSSPDLMVWRLADTGADWSTVGDLPPPLQDTILNAYGGADIPLHRIIADIHSGRVFGPVGPWLMDLAAIALLFLSLTGFYQWFHRRNWRKTKDRQDG